MDVDQISFALTCALSRVSVSDIILFDETMMSIDEELREDCLESLRNTVGGTKTVLFINHEDIEGRYDQVLRLK